MSQSMETSIKDIYAAGDVCTVNWDVAFHWFQVSFKFLLNESNRVFN